MGSLVHHRVVRPLVGLAETTGGHVLVAVVGAFGLVSVARTIHPGISDAVYGVLFLGGFLGGGIVAIFVALPAAWGALAESDALDRAEETNGRVDLPDLEATVGGRTVTVAGRSGTGSGGSGLETELSTPVEPRGDERIAIREDGDALSFGRADAFEERFEVLAGEAAASEVLTPELRETLLDLDHAGLLEIGRRDVEHTIKGRALLDPGEVRTQAKLVARLADRYEEHAAGER